MTDRGAKSGAGAGPPVEAAQRASEAAAPRSAEAAAGDPAGGRAVFYRYRDAEGRVVIVDSLARVPASARPGVERVALEAPARSLEVSAGALARDLHGPSFAAGAAAALLAVAVLLVARRAKALLVRALVLGGLAVLGAGAYFGWLRRTTGASGAALGSPSVLIEDARTAVDAMNARLREQERVLRELEAER